MLIELQTALIFAIVALITVDISGSIAWTRLRRERIKWLIDLKSAHAGELYKARLAAYPNMQAILGQLSSQAVVSLTPKQSQEVAYEINDWIY